MTLPCKQNLKEKRRKHIDFQQAGLKGRGSKPEKVLEVGTCSACIKNTGASALSCVE